MNNFEYFRLAGINEMARVLARKPWNTNQKWTWFTATESEEDEAKRIKAWLMKEMNTADYSRKKGWWER